MLYAYTYHADTDEPVNTVTIFATKAEAIEAMKKDIADIREAIVLSGADSTDDPLLACDQMPSPANYKSSQEFWDAANAYHYKYTSAFYMEDEDGFKYHNWDDEYFTLTVQEVHLGHTITL